MRIRFRVIITAAIAGLTAVSAFATRPEVERALSTRHLHEMEGKAKAAQWQRAADRGLVGAKSWAPIVEPLAFDVDHYSIRLALDFDREVVSGSIEMEATIVEPGLSAIVLDAWAGLRILGVTLLEDSGLPFDSPVDLPFSHDEDLLSVDLGRSLGAGESVRLLITYGGRAGQYGDGINWDTDGAGNLVAWTMAEPFGARVWWPCQDRPDDKATVDLTVTAPSDMLVASNGLMDDIVDHGDGTATTTWSSVYPVATYLVVMNVSDFVYSEETYESDQGPTMPVALFAFPRVAAQAEQDLQNTPEMIWEMARHFGEYPFIDEKYGNCTANFGGGMEHQTLTTISADAVGSDWMPWLNVHELGHQWWGDWITCADWRDLWLNEGFATLTEWLWAERLGDATLQDYLADSDSIGVFPGPVYDNPVPFSGTIYDKGAWVLRMLRHRLGDADFFDGVIAYREAFAGGAATTEDMRAVFEASSGEDLEQFFQQWVYGKNRPRFRYSWEGIGGPALRLVIQQIQTNAGLFEMPLDVRVTTTAGTEDHRIWLDAAATNTVDIPLSASPVGIQLDPDQWNLFLAAEVSEPDIDLGPEYPGPFDFGFASVSEPSTRTIELNNVGGDQLVIYDWGFASNNSDFQRISPTQMPVVLEPGETLNLQASFRAGGLGNRSNWIWVFSNDPDYNGFHYAQVSGQGTLFPGTHLQYPTSLNFGSVSIFDVEERTIEITNIGTDAVNLSATLEGDAFQLLNPVEPVSDPGTRDPILVRFAPETVGEHIGTLFLQSDDPANPIIEVSLRGTGTSAPHLDSGTPSVSFGIVGADGAQASLEITNGGTDDLELQEYRFDGPFEVADADGGLAIVAPQSTRTVVLQTTSSDSGPVDGFVRIRTNDPVLPWATVPIHALFVDTPVADGDRLVIPAAASTAGLGGAWWSTSLTLLNPGSEAIAVDLDFTPEDVPGVDQSDRTVTILPGTARMFDDIVGTLGEQGAGGLTLAASDPGLLATSRTAADGDTGTYGQTIASFLQSRIPAGDTSSVLAGLASGAGFHTNLGVFNVGDLPVVVTFEIAASDGAVLGTVDVQVAAGSFAQAVDALASFEADGIRGAWAMATASRADALVIPYASVVDDASHDPTFIPPTPVDQGALHQVIPTVAANPGLEGTRWATELVLVNPSDIEISATLTFHAADGQETTSVDRLVPAGSVIDSGDVVRDLFQTTGSGWLDIQSSDGLIASCRIFNNAPEGTFGQFIPADFGVASDGSAVVIPGLRSDGEFRTNLGLTSVSQTDTAVDLVVTSESGADLGTHRVTVPAGQFVQLVRFLDQTIGYQGRAWVEVRTLDPNATIITHASVIDGGTGDPSYIASMAVPMH